MTGDGGPDRVGAEGTGWASAAGSAVANSGVVYGNIIIGQAAGQPAGNRSAGEDCQPWAGGRQLAVVTHRLPVPERIDPTGRKARPEGLVPQAGLLFPRMSAVPAATAWVGWPGGLTRSGEPPGVPFDVSGVRMHPVDLGADEFEGHYEGFCNSSLWPLYHDRLQPPVFDEAWFDAYRAVNQRFARAAARAVAPGGAVWVHDYQLQLVPAMLRAARPDLRIGFFLHVPFPPVELFMQLPERTEILRGLLGADLIGFQRPLAGQNLLRLTRDLLGLRPRGRGVEVENRLVRVGAFPVSVDTAEVGALAASEEVRARAREIRAELGDPRTIVLCVDRLDYTKGIEQQLAAFHDLLREERLCAAETVLVQVVHPSRERVDQYQALRQRVEREVGRINGEFGQVARPAVHYFHRRYGRTELVALYCAADVMMATPLRDGMNLVAKEYVAARPNLDGALVLSEFAGAAGELTQAFLCNPHDVRAVKDALVRAVHADRADRERRMRTMRRHLAVHDADRWLGSFLQALRVPVPPAVAPSPAVAGPRP